MKVLLCTSISLSSIMAAAVQDKINQISTEMSHFALMTDATTEDLTVLETDIMSFFSRKFLSLQAIGADVPTTPADGQAIQTYYNQNGNVT